MIRVEHTMPRYRLSLIDLAGLACAALILCAAAFLAGRAGQHTWTRWRTHDQPPIGNHTGDIAARFNGHPAKTQRQNGVTADIYTDGSSWVVVYEHR